MLNILIEENMKNVRLFLFLIVRIIKWLSAVIMLSLKTHEIKWCCNFGTNNIVKNL